MWTEIISPRPSILAPLEQRRGIQWVKEMFRLHRKPAKARAAAMASS